MGQPSDKWMGYGVGRPVEPGEVVDFSPTEWRQIVDRLDALLRALTGEGPEVVRYHEEAIAEWRPAMRAFIVIETEHHFQNFERAFALHWSGSLIPSGLAIGLLNALRRRNRDGPKLNEREAALFDTLSNLARPPSKPDGLATRALLARERQGKAFAKAAEKARRGDPLNDSEGEAYRYGLRVLVARRADAARVRGETFLAKGSQYALDGSSVDALKGDYGRRSDGSRNLWVVRLVCAPIEWADGAYRHAGLLASRCVGNLVEANEVGLNLIAQNKGAWMRGGEIWIEPASFSGLSMPGASLIRWNQSGKGPTGN